MSASPQTTRETAAALVLLAAGVALVAAGLLLTSLGRDAFCHPDLWGARSNVRRCARYVFPTASDGPLQIGAGAAVLGLAWLVVARTAPERLAAIRSWMWAFALRGVAVIAIAFATGEIALRVLYWDGISFGAHEGPFVRRFERDFVTNHYDGPSRGPAVSGPKAPGVTRILIQGDSITWGQGVARESDLYSQRLLDRLREQDPRVEIAALAHGGREIDGHLDQIRRAGGEIQPDAIVYQWFINDIELNKQGRPQPFLPWRSLFLHPILAGSSCFWFFLDYALSQLVPTDRSYEDYIRIDHAAGTANWREFERTFAEWAGEARRLTPRVLVALAPRVNPPDQMLFPEVHDRVRALAAAHGLESIELVEAYADLRGRYAELWASPYDAHPSALAHHRIADALAQRLVSRWPELVHQPR